MRQQLIYFLRLLIATLIYWCLVMCFFILIRYYDLSGEPGIEVAFSYEASIWELTRFGMFLGIFIGLFYAIVEFLFDRFLMKRLYLGLSILIRTWVYLLLLISSTTLIMELAEAEWGFDFDNERGWWQTNRMFWVFVIYFGIFSLGFSFLKIAKERFGRENFVKLLLGKYRKPTEEQRIFMFLDLKSSTTIAETLGHLSYSGLIQECFLDLNDFLSGHRAEVYQYVGDEAVISWQFDVGIRRNNCIKLFFAFQDRLEKRTEHYLEKYSVVPEFKAGLHGGELVVVEVGNVKKELAYHGDVINTAARIQKECNKYGEKLLISGSLLERLDLSSDYVAKAMGEIDLKGKKEKIPIFAIQKA
ncbi:adenylate/guanylate cyclase domain-containing protein [Poritiphilus flavus]|uniref:Adenylate/guanylate cyclase domain-containing protein n=1 Tax=Poritiphilus flavus TaxID=2697053 RepID=A0A6L9EBJ9_9FLAO|nr:adenylate/guanylate cyclase domain-containing protein [Poritiphilus flavus]NAS11982.1 adenylate/guanylate cyclase domain-containing protein [Poritiphilus flavus]